MNNKLISIGLPVAAVALLIWVFLSMTAQTTQVSNVTSEPIQSTIEQTAKTLPVHSVKNPTTAYIADNIPSKQSNSTNEIPQVNEKLKVSEKKSKTEANDYDVALPSLPESNVEMVSNGKSKQDETIMALQEQFYTEAYDEVWAAKTEQHLRGLFSKKQASGNQIEQAACRSTFCRIDVSHDSVETEREFIAAFAVSGQFIDDSQQGYYHREADGSGSVRTIFYLARKGHQLPINTNKDDKVN